MHTTWALKQFLQSLLLPGCNKDFGFVGRVYIIENGDALL